MQDSDIILQVEVGRIKQGQDSDIILQFGVDGRK